MTGTMTTKQIDARLRRLEAKAQPERYARSVDELSDAQLERIIRRGLGLPRDFELTDEVLRKIAEGESLEALR